jgi:2-desacetyl-2-hydroxyethyl bacteriochlorophyllide A dehydrogenase
LGKVKSGLGKVVKKRQTVYFEAPYQVGVREEACPRPGAGEVLVQTAVSAISAGTEMLLYRGQIPDKMATDETIAALAGELAYPLAYGYAAAGEIVACGPDVAEQWLGRLVFAFQPHTSHFVSRPDELLPLPAAMDPETAVYLPNMETAVSFLMDGRPVIGEQVAVLGQGVVGLLTTMLLADLPLASLVTLDAHPLRRRWSRQLGADMVLDPGQVDTATILDALQGNRPYRGADLVYELSGNPQALARALEVVGYNGRILIGSWYGQKQATLDLGGHFHRHHIQIHSSQVSHIAPQWQGRWDKPRRLGVAWQQLQTHQPVRLISHRFPLHRAVEAYQLLNDAPETAVQVIFEMDHRP